MKSLFFFHWKFCKYANILTGIRKIDSLNILTLKTDIGIIEAERGLKVCKTNHASLTLPARVRNRYNDEGLRKKNQSAGVNRLFI